MNVGEFLKLHLNFQTPPTATLHASHHTTHHSQLSISAVRFGPPASPSHARFNMIAMSTSSPLASPLRNSSLGQVVENTNENEPVRLVADSPTSSDDSDEPLSPIIADNLTQSTTSRRKRSSLKRIRSNPSTPTKSVDSAGVDDEESDDGESDGYARGTMIPEDEAGHAEESDDLFLTPRRPTRTDCTTPASNGAGSEYATFDPILALLDDHWACLGLGEGSDDDDDEKDGNEKIEKLPPYLAPLDNELLMPNDEQPIRHSDRELMEALRDADTLDASCARYAAECDTLRKEAATRQRKALRLERENHVAAREINALNEAMATLQAANDVDRRINDLLIADQAEEIRVLRSKLDSRKLACKRSASATSSVSGEPSDVDEFDAEAVPLNCENSKASNGDCRAKEREQLMERKQSMFKAYERRHSMTIQHVVRRSSQMLLSNTRSVGNVFDEYSSNTDRGVR